jgi:hypothetical protein
MIGCDIGLEDRPVDGLRRIMVGLDIIRYRCIAGGGASGTAEHQPEDDRGTHR